MLPPLTPILQALRKDTEMRLVSHTLPVPVLNQLLLQLLDRIRSLPSVKRRSLVPPPPDGFAFLASARMLCVPAHIITKGR
jgi:hypothetical protein